MKSRLRLPKISVDLSRAVWALALRGRFMFTFLVAGLAALSVGVWWSVQTAIDADMRSRLNSEAARVSSTLTNRLEAYGNNLIDLRGRFIVDGVPTQSEFERFMSTLEISKRVPGVKSIGYIALENSAQGLRAPIRLLDPAGWQNRAAIGYDVLTDAIRKRTLLAAFTSGEASLSDQITLVTDPSPAGRGFLIYLPLYKDSSKPEPGAITEDDLLRSGRGLIFAAIRSSDLFEAAFGTPSLKNENVNFSVAIADDPVTVYNRFDPVTSAGHSLTVTKHAQIFGRRLTLVVTPLEHFFTASDRYLPMGVGFGAAFISILVLLVLKSSQIQLLYETRARELSVLAMRKSKIHTERLKRLNESARTLSTELDLDTLIDKFFKLAVQLCYSRRSFLYFAATEGRISHRDSEPLRLRDADGFPPSIQLPQELNRNDLRALMTGRPVCRVGDCPVPEHFAKALEPCSDWLMIELSSRNLGACAVLMVSREDGSQFEEMEVELIESFVSQAVGALDNAQLFGKVEDASKAKNAFLANMSHEIRTPLNAIVGFSEILVDGTLPIEQREGLAQSIRKGGRQLTRIVDDILDLSKVEAGKLLIERKPVDLRTVLKEIRSMVDLRLGSRALAFRIECDGRIPAQIETDEIRLKQILMNLIGNALKFTEDGSVALVLKFVENNEGQKLLSFRVEDTGIGIRAEVQPHLFEPFSQGDNSKTRRFGGSGLGLALSRRLSEELGGDLSLVKSTPNEGSTFEARIQVGAVSDGHWIDSSHLQPEIPNQAEASAPRELVGLEGVELLLVEDSLDNQEIFSYFLEGAGAKLTLAADGLAAVQAAEQGHFDLILMDIQIPEIDGKEATRRIRSHGFKNPIVALTAHAMADERESCLRAGCVGQITKPVSGSELISEIEKYLKKAEEERHGRGTENFA